MAARQRGQLFEIGDFRDLLGRSMDAEQVRRLEKVGDVHDRLPHQTKGGDVGCDGAGQVLLGNHVIVEARRDTTGWDADHR